MSDVKAYLQNDNGDNLLPITDFNYLLNTPSVLQSPDKIKTTDNLLSDTGWITDGVTLGSNTTAANTLANSQPKYRVITIGSVKLVTIQGTISGGHGVLVTYPSEIGLPTNIWVAMPTNNTTTSPSLKYEGNLVETYADTDIAAFTNYYLTYLL